VPHFPRKEGKKRKAKKRERKWQNNESEWRIAALKHQGETKRRVEWFQQESFEKGKEVQGV